ncbi:coA binding domain protein [bacterium BMS3Abin03]|nr:coA binding domain protein [bacterium BMS3Abin03]
MTSKSLVDEFLLQKNIAVVGVSRNEKKFGNVIYRELKKKGYSVYPVNPNLAEVEGDKCYANFATIPEKIDAVIVNVPPPQTERVVEDAKAAGINKVWMQQGSRSDAAVEYCKKNGIDVVENECILMFAEPAEFIHRAHRWLWGVIGKLPK